MLNAPDTNFISSLRKNFINFANDRIQNLRLHHTAICRRDCQPHPFARKTRLQNT